MSKRKKVLTLILTLLCFLLPAWPVQAESALETAKEQRVFDEAKLLTDSDILELENTIAGMRKTMKMDVVVVTTENTGGKNSRNYADDYYEVGGFGTNRNHSGVLFLIDMDNRELYISTEGAMIRFLTDARIENMHDHAYEYAANSDYAGAVKSYLRDTSSYYEKGIPGGQYNYDTETGRVSRYRSIEGHEILLALAVSVGCGLLACLNVGREYAMKAQRKQAAGSNLAYRANAKLALHNQNDAMTNSFVTKKVIPRSTGSSGSSGRSSSGGSRSSTHRSSSGRSHGGGGRKF